MEYNSGLRCVYMAVSSVITAISAVAGTPSNLINNYLPLVDLPPLARSHPMVVLVHLAR